MENTETPAQRLDRYIAENRLIRKQWKDGAGDAQKGYERACLLVALAPACGDGTISACPATLVPPWFAYLTPWIDDAGSDTQWPSTVRTFAALAHRWHVLSDTAWQRLEYKVKRAIVLEARSHVPVSNAVLPAIDGVLALLDRAILGDTPSVVEFLAAKSAAWSAAKSAKSAAWSAAWSAKSAAWSAAWSAESAAKSAAWSAKSAAKSADRMHAEIFKLMTAEIEAAEQAATP